MADQLCTPEDLASFVQQDLDLATATLLIECGTAVVQEAAGGQRIVQVLADSIRLIGTTDSWLDLPQIPVTSVASVTLDGTALTEGTGATNYRLRGNRLWRTCGWQTYCGQPSDVDIVLDHGYAAGAQALQLARSAVLGLARPDYINPSTANSESLDGYSVSFAAVVAAMASAVTPQLKAALRRAYGRRAGLVRIG